MTRLFLAAGVAALAITSPVMAKPGGGGHGNNNAEARPSGGGGGHGGGQANVQRGGGGGGQAFQMRSRGGGGGGNRSFQVQRFERHGGGGGQRFQMQSQRTQRFAFQERGRGHANVQVDRGQRMRNVERQRVRGNQMRSVERQQVRGNQLRNVERQRVRGNELRQAQNRGFERQQMRGNRLERVNNREAVRNELRGNRVEQIQNREALRNELRGNRAADFNNRIITRDDVRQGRFVNAEAFSSRARGYGIGGCPPGLESKGCMPPGQAAKLLGTPISRAASLASLSAVPLSAQYLYPDTNDYYYRYGGDYLYRVDRSSSLIDALLPLAFGGGYYPGSYLPNYYMGSSYFPSSYGFNSFYPASYGGYGYGYDNLCNRYVNGLIYQVDCFTGMIVDVIPLYANGYGVGQLLPTGYGYYNVPYQYRDMYYDTSDYGYWYAPGAIYQYDPGSSLITSVAALLSPGFTVGQPLPLGYDVYNVPYGYRATYYDTPTAWYRYNNGYIYQVDPTTQIVSAIVASILA